VLTRSSIPHHARTRLRDEPGFTLIELLVVCLIIGILAALIIPSFLNQKSKAMNAQAKVMARTAETAAETLATDDDGLYETVTPEELHRIEPTIPLTGTVGGQKITYLSATTHGPHEYSVTATSPEGNELTIARSAEGIVTRGCHSPVTHTGCNGGESSTW
jgi:type IV pilus assembly protein PilA